MVLEGAAADDASSSALRSDTPLSDADRFSASPTIPVFDYTTISNPVPILGPLLGYTRAYYDRELHAFCRSLSRVVERPLEPSEAQATAELFSNVIATKSRGEILGALVGGTQAYRGASTWRFPFRTPNMQTFNPNKFGPLAGQPARVVWHTLRASPYVAFGYLLGGFLFKNAAALQGMRAMQTDSRLTEISEAVQRKMTAAIEQQRAGREAMWTVPSQTQSRVQAQGSDRLPRANVDDASPTGGAFADDFGSGADGSTTSDAPMWMQGRGQGVREERPSTTFPTESVPRGSQTQLPWQSRGQEDDPFAFGGDSSSPSTSSTSSQAPQRSRPTEQSNSGGNAWERLRKQATAQGQNGGNQFAFPSGDEEDARKDFDARIEHERRGKDSADSERGRRW